MHRYTPRSRSRRILVVFICFSCFFSPEIKGRASFGPRFAAVPSAFADDDYRHRHDGWDNGNDGGWANRRAGGWDNGGGGSNHNSEGWGSSSGGGSGGSSGGGAGGSSGGGSGNSTSAASGSSSGGASDNTSSSASGNRSGSGWNYASGGGSANNGGSSVSYDANRNMMKLDLRLGWQDRHPLLESHRPDPDCHRQQDHDYDRHEHEHGHWHRHEHEHEHEHEHRWHIDDFHDRDYKKFEKHLHDALNGWKESNSIETINKTVSTIGSSSTSPPESTKTSVSYQRIVPAPPSETTSDPIAALNEHISSGQQNDTANEPPTRGAGHSVSAQQNNKPIGADARFEIGTATYMPGEVLALELDPRSIERAKALGFKPYPEAISSKASDHIITRLIVPDGMDAVRGQDLLSKEFPGRRFQLNKVYRLYRAAIRGGAPETADKEAPTPPSGAPSRCEADHCFAWQAIGWKEGLARCARGLKVGIIDTDIDESHPVFAGRTIHRFDFSPEGHGVPPNWHGTAVLSLLAGGVLSGVPGLIPDAEFFAANIFFSDERGEMAADTLSLLKALDWMSAFGVKLVNMSFSGPRDELVAEAVAKLSKKGMVFVAAAGNEGPTAPPSYPAAYPQVIAVTAVTKDLHNYRYANRGDHIDVSAPGVNIWTALPGGRAGYQSGTSFAAPYITAILAVEPREKLARDKAALLDFLPVVAIGQEGRGPIYGRGLLVAPSQCMPPWETTASSK